MIQMKEKPNHNFRHMVYALFFYAALIVDFYRKFTEHVLRLPLGVETFRNLVYVALFVLFLVSVRRTKDYLSMVALSFGFGLLTLFSWLLNFDRGVGTGYVDVIFMFFSRLLPAFYIGRYCVSQEQGLFTAMCRLRWLAIAYIGLILLFPETSQKGYITISGNLLIPSLVLLFGTSRGWWRAVDIATGVAGCAVILIYGGRGSLVSVPLVCLLLVFLHIQNRRNAYIAIALVICAVVLLVVLYEDVVRWLVTMFPDSRTLRLMNMDEFFWTSNRDSYYAAGFKEVFTHPFRMHGFLGDRLFFADTFSSGISLETALTMFSHNVVLELLLNFGLFLGGGIVLWLVIRFVGGFRMLSKCGDPVVKRWHLILFGSAIVTLLVSSSYLNDYTAWLIAGSFFRLAANGKHNKEEVAACQP